MDVIRGAARVLAAYQPVALLSAVARERMTPLALLAATSARHPSRVAWRDGRGEVTYAELVADVRSRATGVGPVIIRGSDPRELVFDVLGAICAGRSVAVLGDRAGDLAAEVPQGPGVMFLTSGTTGAPRAHAVRRGWRSFLPYLGMIGRLPRLAAPVLGSPSSPDHGHAFLLVLIAWALGGTYVQMTGPVGRLDVLSGVPIQLSDTLDAGWCPAATVVVSGSDTLDAALVARLERELGAEVWDAYGTTETGPISLATPADVHAGTVGLPLPSVTVRSEHGVLRVTTPATTQVFTGDRGTLDAGGRIRLQGRNDGRVVSGGEVVDPELLRSWLASQPGLVTVDVRTVPHARFGSRLAATITGTVTDLDALRSQIRRDLGPAHVPVTIDLLPDEGGNTMVVLEE